jgi:peptidoglycan/xylan/chitin deacetylase (PgdA/CDA1 family)
MSLYKRIFYSCSSVIPLKLLLRVSAVRSLFPYHHIVSDEPVPHIQHLYSYKNKKQFTDDLDFLLRNFSPVSPQDLFDYIKSNSRLPEKKFLITFDDGFREVAEVIAPSLLAKGVPAIFFINPAFIGNKIMFYRNKISLLIHELKTGKHSPAVLKNVASLLPGTEPTADKIKFSLLGLTQHNQAITDTIAPLLNLSFDQYLEKKRPWLTEEEVSELSRKGFSIGAHSWDHPYYQHLPLEEQVKQTLESCDFIRKTGQQPVCFSFPHLDKGLSQTLFDTLISPGKNIDLLFGTQNLKLELYNRTIHRFNAERPQQPFDGLVKGMLLYSALQKLLNNQTIRRNYA